MTNEEAKSYMQSKYNCDLLTINGVVLVPLYQIIDRLEQQPSEWQQDHAILKAHADGANEVVDRIKGLRGDVSVLREERRTIECHCGCASDIADEVLELIDKLIAEVEGTK